VSHPVSLHPLARISSSFAMSHSPYSLTPCIQNVQPGFQATSTCHAPSFFHCCCCCVVVCPLCMEVVGMVWTFVDIMEQYQPQTWWARESAAVEEAGSRMRRLTVGRVRNWAAGPDTQGASTHSCAVVYRPSLTRRTERDCNGTWLYHSHR